MSSRKINADEFVEVNWTWKQNKKTVGRPEYEVIRDDVPVSDVSFDEIVEYFIKKYEKKNESKLDKYKLKIISISKYKKVESKSFSEEELEEICNGTER